MILRTRFVHYLQKKSDSGTLISYLNLFMLKTKLFLTSNQCVHFLLTKCSRLDNIIFIKQLRTVISTADHFGYVNAIIQVRFANFQFVLFVKPSHTVCGKGTVTLSDNFVVNGGLTTFTMYTNEGKETS